MHNFEMKHAVSVSSCKAVPAASTKKRNSSSGTEKPSVRLPVSLIVGGAGGAIPPRPDGCYICQRNDHHDQILLCEHCNGEYHTYCLQPPLASIPDGDWYCDNCIQFDPLRKHLISNPGKNCYNSNSNNGLLDDGLDRQVAALPYSITKRYNEIVFAQGGTGYGWWPCQIYDPRLAIDPTVRLQAQKYLYTRYLVYFFNCTDSISCPGTNNNQFNNTTTTSTTASAGTTNLTTTTSSTTSSNNTNYNNTNTNGVPNISSATGTTTPFSILEPKKMIKSWVVGLSDDLYFGRASKNHGKQRYRSFCDAFQFACIEYEKQSLLKQQQQQHIQNRYLLDTYVYPISSSSLPSDTTTTTALQQQLVNMESKERSGKKKRKRKKSNSNSNNKKNKLLHHQDYDGVHWIRLSSRSSRKRPQHPMLEASGNHVDYHEFNNAEDDDEPPHPAFAFLNTSIVATQARTNVDELSIKPKNPTNHKKGRRPKRLSPLVLTNDPDDPAIVTQRKLPTASSLPLSHPGAHQKNRIVKDTTLQRSRGRPKKSVVNYP